MKLRAPLISRIVTPILRIVRDRRGGTAIEYGLIAALIVITMLAGFINLANRTTGLWNTINANVTAVTH